VYAPSAIVAINPAAAAEYLASRAINKATRAGFVNTVALMGTAVSEHQIALLKRLAPTVVLMLDGGGAQAVLRAGELARPAGLDVLVASLPAGSDPAALLQRQGAEVARELIDAAIAIARCARLFPDALTRRAAEHIRAHAADPATGLPADDHELISLITGPSSRHQPARCAALRDPVDSQSPEQAIAAAGAGDLTR